MISIIVPVFNAEKFLDRCVQSILEQTYEKFELILVDDGSTDSSRMLCDKYAVNDKRVRSFHKLNGGANSARIMGLENAIGEFVFFVDSDDCIHKEALEKLANGVDDGTEIIIANTNEDTVITGIEWAKKLLERRVRCEIWGGLYKRNRLLEALYCIPSGIVIGEDLLANLYCSLKVKQVKLMSSSVYLYTLDNQMSLVNAYKLSLEHEKLFIETVDDIVRASGNKDLAYSLFVNRYFVLERLLFMGVGIGNLYKEEWVRFAMKEKESYKETLGFKEIVLLSVSNPFVCRWVLKVGIYFKKLLRKYLGVSA